MSGSKISEKEFERICRDIYEERETILKHNPIGTMEETLLWMLMSVLVSYLSINDDEAPCFPGIPTSDTYRSAILHLLGDGRALDFDPKARLEELTARWDLES